MIKLLYGIAIAVILGWIAFVTNASLQVALNTQSIERYNGRIIKIEQTIEKYFFERTFEMLERTLLNDRPNKK